jgi:DNA-binding MarR family transcriptional regulator
MSSINEAGIFNLALGLVRTDRIIKATLERHLAGYGLNYIDWLVLNTLLYANVSGLSMTAVAGALDIHMPQLTVAANRLLKLRLIRQRTQEHDRRSRHLIITIKGKNISSRIDKSCQPVIEQLTKQLDISLDDLNRQLDMVHHIASDS